jgi:hypothetical protein
MAGSDDGRRLTMQVSNAHHLARADALTLKQPQALASDQRSEICIQGECAPEASERASALRYSRSEKTTLFIRTQEGDVVRLKFKTRESTELQAAGQEGGDTEAPEVTLQSRRSSSLSIKVRGDLNPEEAAAIQDAVDQAIGLAEDFFGGDLQAAFASAAAFDVDGEQLARVHLKMRLRETLTYTAQGVVSMPAMRRGVPDTPDAGAVGSGADSAPDVGTNEEVDVAPASTEPAVETPIDAPVDAPVSEPEPAARFFALQAISEFLGLLLDALGATDGERPAGSLHLSLKIRIVQTTLSALSQTSPEEEVPLQSLVNETLEALAEQEQAPIDQVA